MSDNIVIRAENLSKQYRIGEYKGYKTFRESIEGITKKLFKIGTASISKSTDTIWALKNVSFNVNQGEVIGVIGRNGAGKSTLLKILSKITEPTKGRVELKGRVGSLLEVGTGFHPELTGHENIYLYGAILGMDRWEITRKFDEIIAFAELEKFVDTPVKRYSSGMYTRLAFAVAAHLEPEILLVDEVLAVGDAAFQKKCLGKMGSVSREGRTVLFVSHNMPSINALCGKVILMDSGEVDKIGSPSSTIAYYRQKTLENFPTESDQPGLWVNNDSKVNEDVRITSLEMVDPYTGKRKNNLSTRESVAFRLHFISNIDLHDASFQFGISTLEDIVLLNHYTQPYDGVDTPITKGKAYIDCIFEKFPLAAGDYLIMLGVAHTMVKWLYRSTEFGKLTVLPVLDPKGQRALKSNVGYIETEHQWHMVK